MKMIICCSVILLSIYACGVMPTAGGLDNDNDGWTSDVDCSDMDSRAWPGQPAFFETPYWSTITNSKSFDFNCDGVKEKNAEKAPDCYNLSMQVCETVRGGWVTVPACGKTGVWEFCIVRHAICDTATRDGAQVQSCR